MIYEWRTYVPAIGRMADLHRRFREVTVGLFADHGIEVVGFFEEAIGVSPRLHYLLRYQSLLDREAKWEAFQRDPRWQKAKASSEVRGPLTQIIENRILTLTDYSPTP